jgi:hypothetical protein
MYISSLNRSINVTLHCFFTFCWWFYEQTAAYGRDSEPVFRGICYSDIKIFVQYWNNSEVLSSSVCVLSTVLQP